MRITLYIVWWLLCAQIVCAQVNADYEINTAKAGLYHLQGNYKQAIIYYEKAFSIAPPAMLDAYKAAGVYALDGNVEKGYHYLFLALDKGWVDKEWLVSDPYFENLKTDYRWDSVAHLAERLESRYGQTLHQSALRKEINRMTLKDQQLRYLRTQGKESHVEEQDQQNLLRVKAIIAQYGWPGVEDIGKDGVNNLWLLVQHADEDIFLQRKVLSLMEANMDKVIPENYAFLLDRVRCGLNYQQRYGTQVVWGQGGTASGFRTIEDEAHVNERRAALHLSPIETYALTYGFTYTPGGEVPSVRPLLDSIAYYYQHKAYQKVYDLYDQASAVPDGMKDEDNYQAAVTCARIAGQQFKDIALDFLVLQAKRGQLKRSRVQHEKAFLVLKKEPRWKFIEEHLL